MLTRRLLIIAAVGACLVTLGVAQDKSIVVASTTSTQDSGLFGYLLPIFTQKTGIVVKVVAQGTGQALDTARRGDADVVFVHAKSAELEFLSQGFGVKRYPVMYNDFMLIGPQSDPAGIKGKDILGALKTIKDKPRPSFHAVTAQARTLPKSIYGRMRASTSRRKKALGIDQLVKGWARL